MEEAKRQQESVEDTENITMEELLKESEMAHLAPGQIIKGVFVHKSGEGFMFDIGHKREAVVPLSENIPEEMLLSPMKLRVIHPNSPAHGGNPLLSWKEGARDESSRNLKISFDTKSPVEGVVARVIKGGYIVDLGGGAEAFMPGAHTLRKSDKPVGRQVHCIIIEMKSDNIVVSERLAADIVREKAAGEIFSKYAVGDEVEGVVVSLAKFGAFVDIGGIDGLIHVSDVTWSGAGKLEDHIKVGQKLRVKILSMDTASKKISLGLKQMGADPWSKVADKYKVGDTVGCVTGNTTKFGVFCRIEDGVDGLLHVSEVDWHNPNPELAKVFPKRTEIKAKILSVDAARNKISLSVKRLSPSPWESAAGSIKPGAEVSGVVMRVTPFGAVVKISDAIEGTLHVKNLDWFRKISNPASVLKTGQEIKLRVMEFDPEQQRLELSLKHLNGNPFEKYKKKTVLDCTVAKVMPAGVIVEIEPGVEGFIPKNEIARKKGDEVTELVKPGDKLRGVVMESDATGRRIEISVRKFEIEQEKKLLAKYSADKPGPRLEDLLDEV